MQFVNKIQRVLRVLIVMAILAVIVWKFGTPDYFYPAVGVSVLIILILVILTFRTPKRKRINTNSEIEINQNHIDGMSGKDAELKSHIQEHTISDTKSNQSLAFKNTGPKPRATDVAAKYIAMGKIIDQINNADIWLPVARDTHDKDHSSLPISAGENNNLSSVNTDLNTTEPPMPLIEDNTGLTVEETNLLVNAVWCRCENPFCKYTRFLGVHQITNEESGRTNTLNNLIVLCPNCHDLAHKKEIPEEKMHDWINNREERFKFKMDWPY
jgi:hypothetical protein